MARLTIKSGDSYIVPTDAVEQVSGGYKGKAVDKLAAYEGLCDMLIAQQVELSEQMEKLRFAGKTKSVAFKELMIKKLNNLNLISMLKTYDLA